MIGFRKHKKHRRSNPGIGLTGKLRGVTAGFQPKTLKGVLPLAGGAFANFALREALGRRFPVVAKGIASYGVGLAGAGLMLLIPKVGSQMFAGAMTEEVLRAVTEYAMPNLKLLGEFLTQEGMGAGMGYINEFLDVGSQTIDVPQGWNMQEAVAQSGY